MVAPYADGRVARSMVRVPGSGTVDDAVPTCLNLGIVSNLAATVPVPQTLTVNGRYGRQQLKFAGCSGVPTKLGDTVPQGVFVGDGKTNPTAQDDRDVGYTPTASVSRPDNGGYRESQTVSGAVSPMSSSTLATDSGNLVLRSSTLKRPLREGQMGESKTHTMPKRPRIAAKSSVVGKEGYPKNTNQANGRVPTGTRINNKNTLPFQVLSPVPVAVPVDIAQQQRQSLPGSMGYVSSNGNIIPAYAIQTSVSPVTVTQEGIRVNGPFLLVPVQGLSSPLPEGQINFSEVLEDRNRLQRENSNLKYRLALFHQLMRNKEKLRSVLQRMDAAAACA